MRPPHSPQIEPRREKDFEAELLERARAWRPSWALTEDEPDFGRALLKIAARFNAEVAERLDRGGEKLQRGFLDWLAMHGIAARPARMPVVLKLADNAPDPVLATAPVRMQADTDTAPVVFETEADVCLLPGELKSVVGVDAGHDAFYLPPPGLSDLKPLEPLPSQWQLKSFAAAGATKLQLDPDTGLDNDMIVEALGAQYTIVQVDKDIATITPPLAQGLAGGQVVTKVSAFAPFDGPAQNWQEHALYLGDSDLLNIEAAAQIEVVGAKGIGDAVSWQYWAGDEKGWQPLTLASQQPSDGVLLSKPSGAIETKEIGGKSSRWIRAYTKTASGDPFRTNSKIGLRVNSTGCDKDIACEDTKTIPSPAAEAMANTTPLVLDGTFYPLGKQPKQFDAFYLGSQEAFSKKGADVQLCFQMADLTFAALSTISGTNILAGVGQDQALHLLQFDSASRTLKKYLDRDPLRPPSPALSGVAPSSANPVQLDEKPPWRLPMWIEFHPFVSVDLFVAATAGNEVWIWDERIGDSSKSGWFSLGPLSTTAGGTSDPVDGLVFLADPVTPQLAALRGGKLFVRDWPAGSSWTPVPTLDTGAPVVLKSIVPVLKRDAGQLVTSVADGMVGVSDGNDLYSITITGACTKLGTDKFSIASRVAAFKDTSLQLTVVGVDASDPPTLNAFQPPGTAAHAPIPSGAKVVGAVEVLFDGTSPHFLAATENSLLSWGPFDPGTPQLSESDIPSDVGQSGGGPTALGHDVVVPGTHADLLVSDFDVTRRKAANANVEIGIVVPDSIPALAVNDLIVQTVGALPKFQIVTAPGATKTGETFYSIDAAFPTGASGPLLAYKLPATLLGGFNDGTHPERFTLDPTDHETAVGSLLLIDNDFFTVDVLNTSAPPRVVTISSPAGNPLPTAASIAYVRPIAIDGRVAPFMRLDPNAGGNGDWDAGLLQRIKLTFPGQTPSKQGGKAFSLVSNHPVVVVLAQPFTSVIANPTNFIVDAAAGSWARLLGDTSANPELSWEYWNGTGWGKLPIKSDATLNLKASGALRFEVPDDLAPTDWSGKTDCWIRARLVGGDYGSEKITVTTTAVSSSVSQQTVERSTEGISAPLVVRLHIFYRICKPGIPAYLLTQDSGSTRDQSDANRTPGAIVEVFVPLGVTLARLSGTAALTATPPPCRPPCNCNSESTAAANGTGSTPPAATAVAPDTGRSLFLGFTKPLSQQPVNVLLLVDQERDHGEFAPLKVGALIGDHFVPIVTHDTTRALGESGLLSMTFSVGPTQRELFGQPLYWLHLKPAGTDSSDWKPTLRGAYLNAVWASATETMTRELVGSSAGEPNLTLILGRPPLLYNTLELRVREPLGQEARDALLAEDKNLVKSSEQDLPGDWVLWKQVTDPADEAAGARVYALDESIGEIRFGDGRHGAIPPIGSDSIVAFTYQRTEAGPAGSTDVPANSIAERTQLGLVSPVPSVESAISADHAAGGAPPEPPDRVVRFGTARLRHRGRAVTARDIEDLALESSPKIAQACCFVRPGYVKLVVVMQGKTHAPSAAQVRELRSLLLTSAPAALGINKGLRIRGPAIRVVRVDLLLTITDLDFSGEVARDAKQQVEDLFDVATGGIPKNGWQLGQNPDPSDIAYVLSTVDRLAGIEQIDLTEILSDGSERTWAGSLQPTELAVLSDDPVRINFNVVEVVA